MNRLLLFRITLFDALVRQIKGSFLVRHIIYSHPSMGDTGMARLQTQIFTRQHMVLPISDRVDRASATERVD